MENFMPLLWVVLGIALFVFLNVKFMYLIIPVVTGCTMGHSLFPPQPGPVTLMYDAAFFYFSKLLEFQWKIL